MVGETDTKTAQGSQAGDGSRIDCGAHDRTVGPSSNKCQDVRDLAGNAILRLRERQAGQTNLEPNFSAHRSPEQLPIETGLEFGGFMKTLNETIEDFPIDHRWY
jgi:hypothetical protein